MLAAARIAQADCFAARCRVAVSSADQKRYVLRMQRFTTSARKGFPLVRVPTHEGYKQAKISTIIAIIVQIACMLNYTPHLCESAAATSQKNRSITIVLPKLVPKTRVDTW